MTEKKKIELKKEMDNCNALAEFHEAKAFEFKELGNFRKSTEHIFKAKKYSRRYNFLKSSQKLWNN